MRSDESDGELLLEFTGTLPPVMTQVEKILNAILEKEKISLKETSITWIRCSIGVNYKVKPGISRMPIDGQNIIYAPMYSTTTFTIQDIMQYGAVCVAQLFAFLEGKKEIKLQFSEEYSLVGVSNSNLYKGKLFK